MNVSKYSKFIAALGGFVAVVVSVTSDGVIDANDAGAIVTAAVAAGAVFWVRNAEGGGVDA
jgi:hypothetical protein